MRSIIFGFDLFEKGCRLFLFCPTETGTYQLQVVDLVANPVEVEKGPKGQNIILALL